MPIRAVLANYADRLRAYRPSLLRWAAATTAVLLAGVVVLTGMSVHLLNRIVDDATSTYSVEIPYLLDRNRNAMKVERLSSFVRALVLTRDGKGQRRLLIQIEALAQSFLLDEDPRLSAEAALTIASSRKIVALEAQRDRTTEADGPRDVDAAIDIVEAETLKNLDTLTDYLTTDAALSADQLANGIYDKASQVRRDWLIGLGLFGMFSVVLFWVWTRHVLRPITLSVRSLRTASDPAAPPVVLPPVRFLELDMIARAIEQYARFTVDLREKNLVLRELSEKDSLTGLANRRSFDAALEQAFRAAATSGGDFALLMVDIDHFKQVNDRFGHLAGDACIQHVAAALRARCIRPADHAARFGGEEFTILLHGHAVEKARSEAERIRVAIEATPAPLPFGQRPIKLTVSIGLTSYTAADHATFESMLRAADRALYQAKRDGRNCVRVAAIGPSREGQRSAA